jgi:flagellar basal body-associated protein FliL
MGAYTAVATTTAQASTGIGGTGSAPDPAPQPDPDSPGSFKVRRRLTTPARLWVALIAAVVAFLAIGSTCAATLASGQSAETSAAGTSERLVQNVNELYHALAEADASAATALLVGPVPPTRLTDLYNSDINQAVSALSTASRELAGDSAASTQLSNVAGQLPLYTAYIATAQANNRLGYPVAGAYLHEASNLMHGQILKEVQSVADEESAAERSAQGQVSSFPVWIVVVTVLAAVALVLSGRELSRSTRRRLNPGVVVGVFIALAVVIWSLVATTSAGNAANRAQADFDKVATTLWDRDSLALADSYQSLTLVDRGEDNGADLQNQATALSGVDSAALSGDAATLFHKLQQQLITVRHAVDAGDYYKAVDLIVGHGAQASPDTVSADATALDEALVKTFDTNQAAYTADAGAAGSALSGGLWGGLIGGALAALAAVYGINRRLAEYR